MADLKKLFASKKEIASVSTQEAPPQAQPQTAATPAKAGFKVTGGASQPAKPKFGGFKPRQDAPNADAPAAGGVTHGDAGASQTVSQPLTLDDLDNSTDVGITPRGLMSGFADEISATAPTRELPEDLTPGMKQFVDLIDGIYQITHEPDLLGNVIKSIMIELKSNPQYMKLVSPDDVRTWIRAMRDSMGLARIQKTEAKTKRATGKRSAVRDQDMLNDLADLGFIG